MVDGSRELLGRQVRERAIWGNKVRGEIVPRGVRETRIGAQDLDCRAERSRSVSKRVKSLWHSLCPWANLMVRGRGLFFKLGPLGLGYYKDKVEVEQDKGGVTCGVVIHLDALMPEGVQDGGRTRSSMRQKRRIKPRRRVRGTRQQLGGRSGVTGDCSEQAAVEHPVESGYAAEATHATGKRGGRSEGVR